MQKFNFLNYCLRTVSPATETRQRLYSLSGLVTALALTVGLSGKQGALAEPADSTPVVQPGFGTSVSDSKGLLGAICSSAAVQAHLQVDHATETSDLPKSSPSSRKVARGLLVLEHWQTLDEAEKQILPFLPPETTAQRAGEGQHIGDNKEAHCSLAGSFPEFANLKSRSEAEISELKQAWRDWRRVDLYGMQPALATPSDQAAALAQSGYGGRLADMLAESMYVAMIRYTFEQGPMFGKPYWKSKTFRPESVDIKARHFLGHFISLGEGRAYTAEGRMRLAQHKHPLLKRVGLRNAGVAVRDISDMMVWDHFIGTTYSPRLGALSDQKLAQLVHSWLKPAFDRHYAEALKLTSEDMEEIKLKQPIYDFDQRFFEQKTTTDAAQRAKVMTSEEWRFHYAWQKVVLFDFESIVREQIALSVKKGLPADVSLPRIERAAKEWQQAIADGRKRICRQKSLAYVEHLPELVILRLQNKPVETFNRGFLKEACAPDFGRTTRKTVEAALTGYSFVALLAGASLTPIKGSKALLRKKIAKGVLTSSVVTTAMSEISRGIRHREEILSRIAFSNPSIQERNWKHLGWQTHFLLAGVSAWSMNQLGTRVLNPGVKALTADMSDFGNFRYAKLYTEIAKREIAKIHRAANGSSEAAKTITRWEARKLFLQKIKDGKDYAKSALKKAADIYTKNASQTASARKGLDSDAFEAAYAAFKKTNADLAQKGLFSNPTAYAAQYGSADTAVVGGLGYLIPPLPIPGLTGHTYTMGEIGLFWTRVLVAQSITAQKWFTEANENPFKQKLFYLDCLMVLLDAGFFSKIATHMTPDLKGFATAAAAMMTFRISIDYYFQNALYATMGSEVDLRNREISYSMPFMQALMRVGFLGARQFGQIMGMPYLDYSTISAAVMLYDFVYFYFRSHFINQVYVDFLTNPDKSFLDSLKDVRPHHLGLPGVSGQKRFENTPTPLLVGKQSRFNLTENEYRAGVKILSKTADPETLKLLDFALKERGSYLEAAGAALEDGGYLDASSSKASPESNQASTESN